MKKGFFEASICFQADLLGYSFSDMAHAAGICERSFRERMKHPDQFRIKELKGLLNFLKFAKDDKQKLMEVVL